MVCIEQSKTKLSQIEKNIVQNRNSRVDLREKIDSLTAFIEERRVQLGLLQEEEKNMDKTFRRDIQSMCNQMFDQETLKVMYQMYRIRSYPTDPDDSDTDSDYDDEDYDDDYDDDTEGSCDVYA